MRALPGIRLVGRTQHANNRAENWARPFSMERGRMVWIAVRLHGVFAHGRGCILFALAVRGRRVDRLLCRCNCVGRSRLDSTRFARSVHRGSMATACPWDCIHDCNLIRRPPLPRIVFTPRLLANPSVLRAADLSRHDGLFPLDGAIRTRSQRLVLRSTWSKMGAEHSLDLPECPFHATASDPDGKAIP